MLRRFDVVEGLTSDVAGVDGLVRTVTVNVITIAPSRHARVTIFARAAGRHEVPCGNSAAVFAPHKGFGPDRPPDSGDSEPKWPSRAPVGDLNVPLQAAIKPCRPRHVPVFQSGDVAIATSMAWSTEF